MNRDQAKQVLLAYRPDCAEARDPEVAEALDLARRDAELGSWLEQHALFQRTVRDQLRRLEPPPDLKKRIVTGTIVPIPVRSWKKAEFLAIAASIAVLIALVAFLIRPAAETRWSDFQARMVRTALREYHMDIVTSDMNQVRQFLASQNAHADYALSEGLQKLPAAGGGVLRWQGHPVSMVCFGVGEDGNKEILYMFVVNRAAVADPPPATPAFSQVNRLAAAGWSDRDKAYVVVLEGETERLRRLLTGSR